MRGPWAAVVFGRFQVVHTCLCVKGVVTGFVEMLVRGKARDGKGGLIVTVVASRQGIARVCGDRARISVGNGCLFRGCWTCG